MVTSAKWGFVVGGPRDAMQPAVAFAGAGRTPERKDQARAVTTDQAGVPNATARGGNRPSVAVIIPAYNAAQTIGAALASVVAQSLQPSEVIVVDDGSDDDTAAVAEGWSDRLALRILRSERRGPGAARDLGIRASRSDLLALLDADDVWLPDHLATLVRTWAGNPDHLTCAFALWWVPETSIRRGSPEPLPPPPEQLRRMLQSNFASGSSLFARTLYQKAGGFRGEFGIGEDWDLWIRMLRAGGVVVRADHPTFCYRLATTSITSGARKLEGVEAVLSAAVREAATDEERSWAIAGLHAQSEVKRRVRASLALSDAYDAARTGARGQARRRALHALRGPRSVSLRALALLAAPMTTARARDHVAEDGGAGEDHHGR